MKNNLTTTNQSAKLALLKSKSLIDITNKLLANRPNKDLIESFKSFRFSSTLGHKNSVRSVAITQDGKYIVSGSDDETIKLWDIQSGKELQSFEGHKNSVRSVAITPDGKHIVSGSFDGTIKLWDIQSGKELQSFEGYAIDDYPVYITPDGKCIVFGSLDGTIKIWDINSGNYIKFIEREKHKSFSKGLISINLSPGKSFVSQGIPRNSFTLDGISYSCKNISKKTPDIFTPDGNYIIYKNNNSVIIHDHKNNSPDKVFTEPKSTIFSYTITVDGKYLIIGCDNTIKLWNLQSGALHVTFVSFNNGEWLAWKPNGDYNCSDGAYKYFCFVDDSKGIPEVVDESHPVYKAKKKEKLFEENQ